VVIVSGVVGLVLGRGSRCVVIVSNILGLILGTDN